MTRRLAYLHGVHRDVELAGDLTDGQPAGEEAQDVARGRRGVGRGQADGMPTAVSIRGGSSKAIEPRCRRVPRRSGSRRADRGSHPIDGHVRLPSRDEDEREPVGCRARSARPTRARVVVVDEVEVVDDDHGRRSGAGVEVGEQLVHGAGAGGGQPEHPAARSLTSRRERRRGRRSRRTRAGRRRGRCRPATATRSATRTRPPTRRRATSCRCRPARPTRG